MAENQIDRNAGLEYKYNDIKAFPDVSRMNFVLQPSTQTLRHGGGDRTRLRSQDADNNISGKQRHFRCPVVVVIVVSHPR